MDGIGHCLVTAQVATMAARPMAGEIDALSIGLPENVWRRANAAPDITNSSVATVSQADAVTPKCGTSRRFMVTLNNSARPPWIMSHRCRCVTTMAAPNTLDATATTPEMARISSSGAASAYDLP